MTVAAVGDSVIDGVDVDAVVTAVRGCPGVYDLYGGPPQLTATYLPGRRVEGVRVDPLTVVVQVRARWGVPASELTTQIRAAVRSVAPGRRIDIVWADIIRADVVEPPPPSLTPAANRRLPVPKSEDPWTRTNAGAGPADENSSVPITPTGAGTPRSSSVGWRT